MPVLSLKAIPSTVPRPALVQDALKHNKPLYYFGLGSNMSRKKIENRGGGPPGSNSSSNSTDSKIELIEMQAAVVKGYRLAFNLRAFPPLEPGMGSLEPAQAATETTTATNTITNSKSLYMYKDGTECHGALIKLTADNYEKVMRSEGIDHTSNNTQQRPQAYEEIVVDCYPYNHEPNSPPIQAIALRARDHARLPYDPSPSKRYMKILQEGANELGLKQCYQAFLANHPVQELRPWQRKQALYNLIFTFGIMMKSKYLRSCSSLQNRLLYLVYVPSSASWFSKIVSDALTAIILFPGALIGLCLYIALRLVTGSTPAPIQRMMDLLSENEGESKDKKQE